MEKFSNQFSKVFNIDNSIKNCGRKETKKLIAICQEIAPSKDFGNVNNGIMNVEEILKIKERV